MDEEQGSKEWFDRRRGLATGSRIGDIMAKGKSGSPSTTRANYAAQLVAERLTGKTEETFTSAAMAWGTEKEPDARNAYAFVEGVEVQEAKFTTHPTIDLSGASPDGLVGNQGLVEIKCPLTATHITTLLDDKVPARYNFQMQWEMACTGRVWCDFVSYDPRLPERMQLYIKRVRRDAVLIGEMEFEVRRFLNEVADTVKRLEARYGC